MSRRKSLSAAAAAGAAALLAPAAAAQAATLTVDPAAPAGCAGGVCKTIGDANGAAAAGDTISILAGTYTEAVTVLKANLTFSAAEPGKVVVNAAGAAPVFTLGDGSASAGKGTVLRGLVVNAGAGGTSAVVVETVDTVVDASSLTRIGSTSDAPVYAVDDSGSGVAGGVNTLKASFVTDLPTRAEAGSQPAVLGGEETSLIASGVTALVGDKAGAGFLLPGSDATRANQLVGGAIYATRADAPAVEVVSGDAGAKSTVLDSVVLSPGTSAPGLRAATSGSGAGANTVTARHITIAGGARPFALAAGQGAGDVAVSADRSLLRGGAASTVTSIQPVVAPILGTVLIPGNTATLTETQSDTVDVAATNGGSATAVSGATNTPDAQLFNDVGKRDLHLRPTAPVIDKGGAAKDGDSPTDFEGQQRVEGAASDLGADEFVNLPPVAAIKASTATAKQGEAVTFDASGSRDREPAGGIAKYAFDFGDGTPVVESTTPTVTHAFANVGTYTVRVGVVDAQGLGAVASVPVAVSDGSAPTVTVAKPKAGSTLKAYTVKRTPIKVAAGAKKRFRTTKTLRKITFSGTASDAAGVRFVELAIRRVGASTRTCAFLDGKARKFVSKSCKKPVFFVVQFKEGRFTYRLPKGPAYKAGSYELLVRATDANGVVNAPAPVAFKLK